MDDFFLGEIFISLIFITLVMKNILKSNLLFNFIFIKNFQSPDQLLPLFLCHCQFFYLVTLLVQFLLFFFIFMHFIKISVTQMKVNRIRQAAPKYVLLRLVQLNSCILHRQHQNTSNRGNSSSTHVYYIGSTRIRATAVSPAQPMYITQAALEYERPRLVQLNSCILHRQHQNTCYCGQSSSTHVYYIGSTRIRATAVSPAQLVYITQAALEYEQVHGHYLALTLNNFYFTVNISFTVMLMMDF